MAKQRTINEIRQVKDTVYKHPELNEVEQNLLNDLNYKAKLILDKYEFKHNIYSINGNPSTYPSIGGLFYDINKTDSDDHLLLINYQNSLSKKFKNYLILEQVQNCYLIKKIEND